MDMLSMVGRFLDDILGRNLAMCQDCCLSLWDWRGKICVGCSWFRSVVCVLVRWGW